MKDRFKSDPGDRKINRWSMYAQVVTCVVAVIALILSGYSTYKSQQASEDARKALEQDDVRISNAKRMPDFPTTVSEISVPSNGEIVATGVLTVYWEFMVSNNGVNDVWLVEYILRSLREAYPAYYPGMNQGLFLLEDGKLVSTDVPLPIPSGTTVVLYAGIRLLVDLDSYRLITGQFNREDKYTLRDVTEYLGTKGVDLYGNRVESIIPGVLNYTSPDEVKEQWFISNFETSRGLLKARFISWYAHSGIPEGRVQ